MSERSHATRLAVTRSVGAVALVGVGAGALVALVVSEQTSVVAFMKHGQRFVFVLGIVFEVFVIVVPALLLAWSHRRRRTAERAPAWGHLTPVIELHRNGRAATGGAPGRAVPKCYEIALPGLRMEAELSAVRSRLLADFPQILSVDAMPTLATLLILYVGDAEPDAWFDALSDAVLSLRGRLRPSRFARPSRRRTRPRSSCPQCGGTRGCPGRRVRSVSRTSGTSGRRPRRTRHSH